MVISLSPNQIKSQSGTMPHATICRDDGQMLSTPPTTIESSTFSDSEIQEIIYGDQLNQQLPRNVQTTLHYLSPNIICNKYTPPIQVVTRAATYQDPRTSVKLSQGPSETVYDVRGQEDKFCLEKNGFVFLKHRSVTGELESRERIWKEYVEVECRDVVAKAFGGRDGGVDEIIAFHEGVSDFLGLALRK
jgi:hypothetical protein